VTTSLGPMASTVARFAATSIIYAK
jgi:hypothetical protein